MPGPFRLRPGPAGDLATYASSTPEGAPVHGHVLLVHDLPRPKGAAADGALTCEPDACLFRPRDGVMPALLVRGPARPNGCAAASVVVSAGQAPVLVPTGTGSLVVS